MRGVQWGSSGWHCLPTWGSVAACCAVLQAAKAQLLVHACLLGLCTLSTQAGFREAPFGGEGDVYLTLMQRKTSTIESLKALELLERKGFLMHL